MNHFTLNVQSSQSPFMSVVSSTQSAFGSYVFSVSSVRPPLCPPIGGIPSTPFQNLCYPATPLPFKELYRNIFDSINQGFSLPDSLQQGPSQSHDINLISSSSSSVMPLLDKKKIRKLKNNQASKKCYLDNKEKFKKKEELYERLRSSNSELNSSLAILKQQYEELRKSVEGS